MSNRIGRFRFSLRACFVAVTLVVSVVAVSASRVRQYRAVQEAVWGLNGSVSYDFTPDSPAWVKLSRTLLGDEIAGSIAGVSIASGRVPRATLESIASLSSIRSLGISSEGLSNSDLQVVGKMTSLRELSLESAAIDDVGIAHLTSLKQLRLIHIAGERISSAAMTHVATLPNLQVVELHGGLLTDEGIQLDDSGLKILAGLGLHELAFNSPHVTDACLQHIGRMNSLIRLRICSPSLSGQGLQSLSALTNLESLELRTPKIEKPAVDELKRLLPRCTIYLVH